MTSIDMHHDFWHSRWQSNQIGFHLGEVNPFLVKHFSALNLQQAARVFLPLCGKSLDIHWLLAQGFCVAGAELSTLAVEALFADLKLTPTVSKISALTCYSAKNIDIFNGDFFDLTAQMLGKVDAVYDRAALVALPDEMRQAYTAHLMLLSAHAPQLLISFAYDQAQHAGPPFSIGTQELQQYYLNYFEMRLLDKVNVVGGLKGKCPAIENVYLLQKNSA